MSDGGVCCFFFQPVVSVSFLHCRGPGSLIPGAEAVGGGRYCTDGTRTWSLRLCEIVLPFDFTCAFLVQGSTVLKVQHLQTILVSRLVAVGISHQAASCFAQQWL